jgi:hypothetical protein
MPHAALVTVAVAVAGAAVAAMAAADSVWTLGLCNAVLLLATSQAGLLVRSIRQEIVPRHLLGRVTATVRTVFVSATPLGALLAGAATTAMAGNPRPVFAVAGTALVACTAVAWATVLRHHTRPPGP